MPNLVLFWSTHILHFPYVIIYTSLNPNMASALTPVGLNQYMSTIVQQQTP